MKRFLLVILAWLSAAGAAQAQVTFKPGEKGLETQPAATPEFRTDRGDFEQAAAVYQTGDSARAMQMADEVIATYEKGPWVERAMLLKARARFKMNDFAGAEKELETLQRRFPATGLGVEVSDLRLAIANSRMAAGKSSGPRALEQMVEDNPYGPRSDDAQFELGRHHLDRKEYSDAADAFALLLTHYPDSRHREEAMFLRAKTSYLDNTGPQRDPRPFEEAREGLLEYLKEFPSGAHAKEAGGLLQRADNALAQKLFLIGEWYRKDGHSQAAERYYQAAVTKYPKSLWAKRAREQLPVGWEPPPKPETTPATPAEEAPPPATEEIAPAPRTPNGAPRGPGGEEPRVRSPAEGRTDVAPSEPAPEPAPRETTTPEVEKTPEPAPEPAPEKAPEPAPEKTPEKTPEEEPTEKPHAPVW